MLGNILNGIPVVGHIKAGFHLLANDPDGAVRAFAAATRSTAMMAAGTAGALAGGPAGAVAGGIAAGTACDALSSAAKGQADGVFSGVKNIAEELVEGRVPVKSLLQTGVYVGADALSGVTGGGMSILPPSTLPFKLSKDIVKNTVIIGTQSGTSSTYTMAVVSACRELADHILPSDMKSRQRFLYVRLSGNNTGQSIGKTSQSSGTGNTSQNSGSASNTNSSSSSSGNTSESQKNSSSASGGSSGPDPPRDGDKRNQKAHVKNQNVTLSHFDALLKLFKASELGQVTICGIKIFAEITSGKPTDKAMKDRLKVLIKKLRNDNIFERVIEAVRNIFKKLPLSEFTFQNFLYLCEMVASYVSDRLARRMELQSTSSSRPTTPFHVRRAQNLAAILQEILQPGSPNNIFNIFTEIRSRIASAINCFSPTFSSEISATYHYFKHKFVPDSTEVLTIEQYLQLVTASLSRIRQSSYYRLLQNGQARRLVYDRYYQRFQRRVRVVLQVVDSKITLSTCHILDDTVDGDYDGFEHYQTTE